MRTGTDRRPGVLSRVPAAIFALSLLSAVTPVTARAETGDAQDPPPVEEAQDPQPTEEAGEVLADPVAPVPDDGGGEDEGVPRLPEDEGESSPDAEAGSPPVAPSVTEQGTYRLRYLAHVQNVGWQPGVSDGATAGTSGRGLRLEGLRLEVLDAAGAPLRGAVRYKAHVQDVGWQGWVRDGGTAGSVGRARRVEALRLELVDAQLASRYDIAYRVHVQNHGWLAWATNGELAGSVGRSLRIEAIQVVLVDKEVGLAATTERLGGFARGYAFVGGRGVSVSAHVQNVGWQAVVGSGAAAGAAGRGLRIEALRIALAGFDPEDGGIAYEAHVQNVGWQGRRTDGAVAGTTGRSLRVEALRIWLTGKAMTADYDVYYRAYLPGYGWLGWAKNGESAGSGSMSTRLEAVQVRLVGYGEAPPSDPGFMDGIAFLSGGTVSYGVQTADGRWRGASDGKAAGTTGASLSASSLRASVSSADGLDGGITYAVSPDGTTWMPAAENGEAAGAEGAPLQAVRMSLTGTLARVFDLYYRTHVSSFGWQDWARNGEAAGTAGYGFKVEAIEVRLVARGGAAPGARGYQYFDNAGKTIGQLLMHANAAQRRVASMARLTPSPGGGLCALWVSQVLSRAGAGYFGGDARDQYRSWCHLTRLSDLKVGMIVAVPTHSHTAAGRIWGHVCVYVGDGMVMDNVGSIRTKKLTEWLGWYGDLATPKWGWLGNRRLA